MKKESEKQKIKRSAELYAEIYDQDSDLSELTDAALSEWPEDRASKQGMDLNAC